MNILDLTQQTEDNAEVEVIQEKGNETNVEQFQHFWPMHSIIPTMTTPRKKINMQEKPLCKQISDQGLVTKGFLQNKQMERVSTKNWGEGIAYIRNLFALSTVWINPIRLDSKLGQWKHETLTNWIIFMWETMMPKDLASYIRQPAIFEKLDQLRQKENSAINLVLKYMDDGHLDEEIKLLITVNYNFYRLVFSNTCYIIYFNTSECCILKKFIGNYESWRRTKEMERRSYLPNPSHLSSASRPCEPVQVIKVDPDPLTEAEKREILKKQKSQERERVLKKRLHEMNGSEKKNKELAKLFFAEKRKKTLLILRIYVNFFL